MIIKDNIGIEEINSEIKEDYSYDLLFDISSCGADLSFREIITMYDDDELIKTSKHSKYAWDKIESSKFIESILFGIPVPSIFLAQLGSQKLIVDGYQRIKTVYDYVKRGVFSNDHKIFKLSNSEKINSRWRNKAYAELSVNDQRKIKATTIHAIILKQKKYMNDDRNLYQIFEYIRNCIHKV